MNGPSPGRTGPSASAEAAGSAEAFGPGESLGTSGAQGRYGSARPGGVHPGDGRFGSAWPTGAADDHPAEARSAAAPPADERSGTALVLPPRPARPKAAVLVLHGGREDSAERSRPWHPPGLRMVPYVRALNATLGGADTVVGRVRYRLRGWNGKAADPLRDAVDALHALEDRVGAVPVVMIGHSMGGRAAIRAAGYRSVLGVVALAPWIPPGEPVDQLSGRTLVVVHGDRDRITSPAHSRDFARRAREAGVRTARLVVEGGEHAMVARARDWHTVAVASVSALLGRTAFPPELEEAFSGSGPGAGLDVPLPPGAFRGADAS